MNKFEQRGVWVTFAVPEEAGPFRRLMGGAAGPRVLLTGMGAANARRVVAEALAVARPQVVISSGFAGGLNPALPRGQVVVEAADGQPWGARLLAAGAVAGRFEQTDRVLISPGEKADLWRRGGADAVEMESMAIRQACVAASVPWVVARVISDAADESLPLDFNVLMGPDHRLRYGRLVWEIVRSPGKVPELIRFQRRVRDAAGRLAVVLRTALEPVG